MLAVDGIAPRREQTLVARIILSDKVSEVLLIGNWPAELGGA
jgi:hypothetical protein